MTIGEARRATRTGDTIGHIEITFTNAFAGNRKTRTRPDLTTARRLVAHYQPYNNTRIDAWQTTRIEGGYTYSVRADLTVDGAYRFCPCLGDETDCNRPTT